MVTNTTNVRYNPETMKLQINYEGTWYDYDSFNPLFTDVLSKLPNVKVTVSSGTKNVSFNDNSVTVYIPTKGSLHYTFFDLRSIMNEIGKRKYRITGTVIFTLVVEGTSTVYPSENLVISKSPTSDNTVPSECVLLARMSKECQNGTFIEVCEIDTTIDFSTWDTFYLSYYCQGTSHITVDTHCEITELIFEPI